ncbi:MAG: GerMN domain-containing protein [Acidimicrobiales bacterium]
MSRVLPVLVAICVLSAACGDDPQGSPTSTTTAPEATSTSTTSPTSTTVPPSTSEPESIVVQVFFLDEEAFNIGRLPYVRPVERAVDPASPEAAALDALFEGPTSDEQAGGLRFVASEATGIAEFSILERTAQVRLAGGCSSGGSTFTVANQIVPTLLQFTSIDAVKIYDPAGETGSPDTPGDSIPFCLEP